MQSGAEAFRPPKATTVAELAEERGEQFGERPLYGFLKDGDVREHVLSYAGLDRWARAHAAQLQQAGIGCEPVLLVIPPGLEYVAALFGCFYAGAIAVPAYPPFDDRTRSRLLACAKDSGARWIVGPRALQALVAASPEGPSASLAGLRWLFVDDVDAGAADAWRPWRPEPEDLAMLQYTSGSTADPKGVMLQHGNLIHNLSSIQQGFGTGLHDRGVIWLPPYHDMGLIGGILQGLYVGGYVDLFSPISFLKRPARWLRAISEGRGTVSGGPNFAYEMCIKRVSEEEKRSLDLSCWRVAFNGAEPIQAATLDRFAAAFESCGFRREAFYPCYGLAEASLIVSGGDWSAPPRTQKVPHGTVLRDSVGSGVALGGQELRIVDPERHVTLPDGEIGEIWLRGPSVAAGYWGRAAESSEVFEACLHDGAGPFLRTGDMGLLRDGELFVTGRRKALIIADGRNLHPEDLEITVEHADPRIREGGTAVFAVSVARGEGVAAMIELARGVDHSDHATLDEIARAVVSALSRNDSVALHSIAFVGAGTLPKTLSGKKQRSVARDLYLNDGLSALGRWARGGVAL